LAKYSGGHVRQRGSSPKLLVLNTALLSAATGTDPAEGGADYRGRLAESAVGAHLANAAAAGECELFYWRWGNREVDFVVKTGGRLTAIEVKTGHSTPETLPGIDAFAAAYKTDRTLLIGTGGIPLDDFLSHPVRHWTA